MEIIGFIGVSCSAYRAHAGPVSGTCQVWRGRARRDMARGRAGRSGGHTKADVRDTEVIDGRVAADIDADVVRAS